MPGSLLFVFRYRWVVLAGVLAVLGLSLWVLTAELLLFEAWGRVILLRLHRMLGFWPVSDHTVQGLLGLYPHGFWGKLSFITLGVLGFFGTQVWLLWPGRRWAWRLAQRGRMDGHTAAAAALATAVLAAGWLALVMDGLLLLPRQDLFNGLWWGRLNEVLFWVGARGQGVGISTQSLLAGAVGLAVWVIAWRVWPRLASGEDRFWQLCAVLFWLFVGGGVLLLICGFLMVTLIGLEGRFWLYGAFSGGGAGFVVVLWTMLPSVAVIFASERYGRWRQGCCLACGYDLRGTVGGHVEGPGEAEDGQTRDRQEVSQSVDGVRPACPECGQMVGDLMLRRLAAGR